VITEFFEENNVPTESCDVHYQGVYCNHDLLPACADCPFKVNGVIELPLVEDASLISGSTMIVENPDGTQTVTTPVTNLCCQHTAEFFANPNYEAVISQQTAYIQQRNAAALAALQAAGLAQ